MDTLNTTSSTPFSGEGKLKCPATSLYGLPRWLNSKEFTCNAGQLGLIPGSGRCPGDVNGNPLQYSCLENPMDGGAWWATVHGLWVRHNFATKHHHHHHHQARLSYDSNISSPQAQQDWSEPPSSSFTLLYRAEEMKYKSRLGLQ